MYLCIYGCMYTCLYDCMFIKVGICMFTVYIKIVERTWHYRDKQSAYWMTRFYKETHQLLENPIFVTLLEFHYLMMDVFLIEFLRRLMPFNFKLIFHDEKMFKNWLVCNFFLFYWIKQVPTWCYPFIPVSSYEDARFQMI